MQPLIRRLFATCLLLVSFAANAQQFDYNFDSLKRVITRQPGDTASTRAYIDYAAKFFFVKSDSGLHYLAKALLLAKQQPDPFLYLFGLKNKADYYSISGDLKAAVSVYRSALAIPARTNSWLLKVKIRSNLGTAYKNMGLLDSAQSNYQQVTEAYSRHRNGHRDSVGMAFSYMQLYDLYQVQGLLEEAIYYGDKGFELSKALKADRGIAYGLYIQALKYQQKDPALSLRYADRAYQLAVRKNIAEVQQFSRHLKAKVLISLGKYQEAKAALLPGTRFTAGSVTQATYARLADVFYHLNELPKALSYFKQSYALAVNTGYHAQLVDVLQVGIAIYEKLKDYRNAQRLQKEYQLVLNQIASAKIKLDYQRAALRFKSAEQEKQLAQKQLQIARQENRLHRQALIMTLGAIVIVLVIIFGWLQLQQQRRLRKQREIAHKATGEIQTLEAMIKGEETERVRLAKDLHDGVGGLLSAVKMRFSTFKNEFPELKQSPSFNQGMRLLDEASAEIRKTAHNLMPDLLTRSGLDEAVQAFCNNVSLQNRLVVDYQSVGHIGRFQENAELALYRVVQELVNNMIKHAKASHALVQFTRQDDVLTISIEDDGQGFEPATAGKGLGLSSVADRLAALKGSIDVDSSPGKGTAIYIELDVSTLNKKQEEIHAD